ncbi:MAG: Rab family GTPase [Candidatus Thorarchaeota archaeon]
MTQRDDTADLTQESESSDGSDGFKFRVVLLGEATVGKTSLLRRYTENVFEDEYKQTLGTTFATKEVEVKDETGGVRGVKLSIWDMGGQSTYRELRRQYMKGSSAAIIVYDVTKPESFMAMNNWFESFREVCPDAPIFICANKVDLTDKRMVPQEPGMMLRDWFQSEYYETSAKDGTRVTDVFERCAQVTLSKSVADKDPIA